jgi:hypothetical protein
MTFTRGPNWSSASSGQLPSNGEVAIPPKLVGVQSLALSCGRLQSSVMPQHLSLAVR